VLLTSGASRRYRIAIEPLSDDGIDRSQMLAIGDYRIGTRDYLISAHVTKRKKRRKKENASEIKLRRMRPREMKKILLPPYPLDAPQNCTPSSTNGSRGSKEQRAALLRL